MNLGVVIPATAGREENLVEVLRCLDWQQDSLGQVVIVDDGGQLDVGPLGDLCDVLRTPKHEPGMEQPRNLGVRRLRELWPEATHAWFLDSDVIVQPDAAEQILGCYQAGPTGQRIMVCPYDWLGPGYRPRSGWFPEGFEAAIAMADPRWVSFNAYEPDELREGDLAAGLACFSGNLVWPIEEFKRVGGFWNDLHHGRCEDGELGIRAVAMGVPISFCAAARGLHLWHEVNVGLALERNERDVPMLNDRHPWMVEKGVFMVDRDGKAFDVRCPNCTEVVPTIGWWQHAESCGRSPGL